MLTPSGLGAPLLVLPRLLVPSLPLLALVVSVTDARVDIAGGKEL